MSTNECELGMVGLGVMGRNLLLNMADHGHATVGYDRNAEKVAALRKEAGSRPVRGADTVKALVASLRKPRAVMMLVPAGGPVDAVIEELLPCLEAGDLIIDGGNSHFRDTDRRARALTDKGIGFLGVGVSGGEHGARYGPSIMPGGNRGAYERVQRVFEDTAARVGDEPCVTYLGPGAAGHYVKMVHNGIEYGLMQLIAESYDLMRRGLGLGNDDLADVFDRWNGGRLAGFLIEITADVFRQRDDKTDERLVDVILDQARQKGTGMWTSQEAMELQSPAPTIDAAVAARHLSALGDQRATASGMIGGPEVSLEDGAQWVDVLDRALHAAMLITYAQGLALLWAASEHYDFNLRLADVARIWRGGCIIRTSLLEDIRRAYESRPDLENLLLDPKVSAAVAEELKALRTAAAGAARTGIPAPAVYASLAYVDGYRRKRLPANLIQAQRDYFGAHTYERVDTPGTFHTQWGER